MAKVLPDYGGRGRFRPAPILKKSRKKSGGRKNVRQIIYLVGVSAIIDGMLHLLFPERWGNAWVKSISSSVPAVGEPLEKSYKRLPQAVRRGQGLWWLGLGALLLWWVGSIER